MEFNNDIIKIIKEYSMPKYKRTLHFLAIKMLNDWGLFEYYKWRLRETPYTLNILPLADTFFYEDNKIANNNFKCLCYYRLIQQLQNRNIAYEEEYTDEENEDIFDICEETLHNYNLNAIIIC